MTVPLMPRIAVIGTGWWATSHHIPSLIANSNAELVALADTDATRLEAAGEHFGIDRLFVDPEEMMGSGILDGVIIATPHIAHYDLARAALNAGLHTFVEKPLALRASEAWELVTLAERHDAHLSVGYTAQYTPAAAALRTWFSQDDLGSLLGFACVVATANEPLFAGRPEAHAGHYGFGIAAPKSTTYASPAVAGGGQAQTQLTHTIGMLLYVTGLTVTDVFARTNACGLAVDLVDAIVLRLSDGSLGTIASTGSVVPGQRETHELRYFGRDAAAVHDILRGVAELATVAGREVNVEPDEGSRPLPNGEPARAFVELIAGRGENRAPAATAAHTVAVIEAIYESAALGASVTPWMPPAS